MNVKRKNGFIMEPEMRPEAEDDYKECSVCHQEFTGTCPMMCADCPLLIGDASDIEEEKQPDFEDVERVDQLVPDDQETELIVAEAEELPPDDLTDD